ncbi:MAG: hypothetical protein H7X76_00365 [Prolixibacteraceae bacterium]|nr:hypothetical protein [Burkholderiales bacterium]
MNELEIKLASANREDAPDPGARRDAPATNNNQPRRNRPGGGQQGKRPPRKFHK